MMICSSPFEGTPHLSNFVQSMAALQGVPKHCKLQASKFVGQLLFCYFQGCLEGRPLNMPSKGIAVVCFFGMLHEGKVLEEGFKKDRKPLLFYIHTAHAHGRVASLI